MTALQHLSAIKWYDNERKGDREDRKNVFSVLHTGEMGYVTCNATLFWLCKVFVLGGHVNITRVQEGDC